MEAGAACLEGTAGLLATGAGCLEGVAGPLACGAGGLAAALDAAGMVEHIGSVVDG